MFLTRAEVADYLDRNDHYCQKSVRIQTQKVNLALLKHLREFKSEKILIRDIDSKFCHDFTEYLTNEKKLKNSSAITYLQKLHAVLQEAVYLNHIPRNPMPPISRLLPKHIKIERASLTVEEIRRMEKTKCRHELTKLAFLFSCYTGLLYLISKHLNGKTFKSIIIFTC